MLQARSRELERHITDIERKRGERISTRLNFRLRHERIRRGLRRSGPGFLELLNFLFQLPHFRFLKHGLVHLFPQPLHLFHVLQILRSSGLLRLSSLQCHILVPFCALFLLSLHLLLDWQFVAFLLHPFDRSLFHFLSPFLLCFGSSGNVRFNTKHVSLDLHRFLPLRLSHRLPLLADTLFRQVRQNRVASSQPISLATVGHVPLFLFVLTIGHFADASRADELQHLRGRAIGVIIVFPVRFAIRTPIARVRDGSASLARRGSDAESQRPVRHVPDTIVKVQRGPTVHGDRSRCARRHRASDASVALGVLKTHDCIGLHSLADFASDRFINYLVR